MSSIPSTSYILDSRQKTGASTNSVAVYNLAALGSPVEAGTYEVLSFNTSPHKAHNPSCSIQRRASSSQKHLCPQVFLWKKPIIALTSIAPGK